MPDQRALIHRFSSPSPVSLSLSLSLSLFLSLSLSLSLRFVEGVLINEEPPSYPSVTGVGVSELASRTGREGGRGGQEGRRNEGRRERGAGGNEGRSALLVYRWR